MDQEKEKRLLSISVSPHIRSDEDTRSIMLDVLIALVPALGWRPTCSASGRFW